MQGKSSCSLCVPIPQLLTTSVKSQELEDAACGATGEHYVSLQVRCFYSMLGFAAAAQLPPCAESDLLSSF